MTSSLITKKKIAKAFKTLLLTEDFEKISIVDMMELAQLRRQTFYNHFLDKYQLLDWIFENDLKEQITDNLSFITGKKLLIELFDYFKREQKFYDQLFKIKGQNDFYSSFIVYCKTVVEKIWQEYGVPDHSSTNAAFAAFHIHYHAHALAEITKCFVIDTTVQPDADFLIFEMTNNLRGKSDDIHS